MSCLSSELIFLMRNSFDNQCHLLEINAEKNDLFNKQSHEFSSVIIDNIYDSNDSAFSYEIEQLLDKKVTNIRSKIKIEYLVR